MRLRQSMLATWMRCPLQFRWKYVDGLAEEQSAALTFGTLVHEAVLRLEESEDLEAATAWFVEKWTNPPEELAPAYFLPRTSQASYLAQGKTILQSWWEIVRWRADVVIAREHHFVVPVEGTEHELEGTVDRLLLRYQPKKRRYVLVVSDLKTNRKQPTYGYLRQNLQFTAYAFATTHPDFWDGIDDGAALYERYRDVERYGEWVHLMGPRRFDAGERTAQDYARLRYAINAIADSVAFGIFPPDLTGTECAYCEFRKPCGLPETSKEG